MLAALPVVTAVGVFGISYGVLGVAAGIPGWQLVVMSMTVFAGSSQFAAVSALGGAGGAIGAIVSGGLLNTRYLATGTAAGRVLPGGRIRRALLGQLVVDESYALGVAVGGPDSPDPDAMLAAGSMEWLAWVVGSAVGVLIGPVVGDPMRLGLDAAFPAMFVALLWPLLDRPGARRCALGGALAVAVVAPLAPGGLELAAAGVVGLILAGDGDPSEAGGDAGNAGDAGLGGPA
ncbi:MAG: hypothetical protein QOI20_2793 [Acidimicrobiaceae bacterium]|nr:hypothetical protein [Acidimicrobiaceae bacterium]